MARYDYKVALNDGTVSRRSSDRVYTHAVAWKDTRTGIEYNLSYCGSLALAQKARPSQPVADCIKMIYPVEVVKDRGNNGLDTQRD